MNSGTSSVLATEPRTAADPLAALVGEAASHRAVRHPWLLALAAGNLPDPAAAVHDFAVTYRGYSQWFPRYLQTVIDRLHDPRHRDLLAENLAEEKGELHPEDELALAEAGVDVAAVRGVPHPELFRRFQRAMGITEAELAEPKPEARRWRECFLHELQQGSPAFCVGALGLGTEGVVKPIYALLLQGIRRAVTLTRADLVFFELHCLVDDQHQKDLLAIAAELAAQPGGAADLQLGMRTALALRARFWDELHRRALRAERAA